MIARRSRLAVPRRERLIVALDVPNAAEARAAVERLGDAAGFYKLGLELAAAPGYHELVAWLGARGCRVFADLKLYDIPETVRRAVANLRDGGASFVTVHGNRAIMEAAAKEKGRLQILAVTVLTSLEATDLAEMGYAGTVEQLVLSRARGALDAGCDGVVASGREAPGLRDAFGTRLQIVTPGVRPDGRPAHDQKRTVDVAQAFTNGADYIVVGRPILRAPDPRTAAQAIQRTIAGLFAA
jgi:orotidine-5'-phosphate decarboxylase